MARKAAKLKVLSGKPKPERRVIPFTKETAFRILQKAYPTAIMRFRTEELYRLAKVDRDGQHYTVDTHYWFKVEDSVLDTFTGGAWNSLEEAFSNLIHDPRLMKRITGEQ